MSRSIANTWRVATLQPRKGLPELVHEDPRLLVLLFPAAWGVLQSLMQGATNNMGLQGSVPMIFAFALPIGGLWGLLQVHVLSGAIWAVTKRDGARLPFARIRHVVALSAAPAAYALLAWVVASLLIGRAVFVDPEALATQETSAVDLLRLTILYFGTAACLFWSIVLLVLGLREVVGTSTLRAVGLLIGSTAVLFLVAFVLVLSGTFIYVALGV